MRGKGAAKGGRGEARISHLVSGNIKAEFCVVRGVGGA